MATSPTPFRQTRKRLQGDPSNRAHAMPNVATLSVVANKLRMTFVSQLSLSGIPQVSASGGAHTGTELPTAATIVSANSLDLTYAHNVAAGDAIIIPSFDTAIRFANGAYVQAKSATL